MKSTFSRLFIVLSLILLAATVLVSGSFQWVATRYLTEQAITSLQNDAKTIASLYQSSYADQSISRQDFYMAMTVAVSVSGADAVICDADGSLLMCADAPLGCEHTGLQLKKSYRDRVFATGGCTDTGVISGLYEENRYIVSVAVTDAYTGTPQAIVLVSSPVDNTLTNIRRISNTFLIVTILVVLMSVVIMTFFVRRQSSPLQDMAKAARAFGHGDPLRRPHLWRRRPHTRNTLANGRRRQTVRI